MYLSTAQLTLALASLASAQYGSGSGSDSSSTSTSAGAQESSSASSGPNHIVKVGDGGLTFEPNDFKAAVGDTVEFHFYPKQHSVAQSSFAKPCAPLNDNAFFSGPMPTQSGMAAQTWTLTVNDTKPIWFYCATPNHCQGGMSGVINGAAGKTLDMYQQAAKEVSETTKPAQPQGGVMAAMGSTEGSPSATSSGASASSSGNAGIETRGSIQWAMFGLTGVVAAAAGVGHLLL